MIDWSRYNFTEEELRCKGTGMLRLHPGFLDRLQELREAYGRPMPITSGCRSREHNARERGARSSLHICDAEVHPGMQGTLAVDVATTDAKGRGDLFALAWQMGWSVGWGGARRFLHLDLRTMLNLRQTTFDY